MRRAFAVLGVALLGSQAGHLLAYEVRFSAAAQQVQSTGAHTYFPTLAKTLFGVAALLLLAALVLVGFARLATGRRIVRESAPSLLRLVAVMYTLQLALFVAQETIEGTRASEIVLWGFLGQLPAALAGAVALRWLLARVVPAIVQLRTGYAPAIRLVPRVSALVVWPVAAEAVHGAEAPGESFNRRGPPSF
jgi:hypothetical protein